MYGTHQPHPLNAMKVLYNTNMTCPRETRRPKALPWSIPVCLSDVRSRCGSVERSLRLLADT